MSDLSRRNVLGSMTAAPLLLGAAPAATGVRLKRGINIHHLLGWPLHVRDNPVEYSWPPFSGSNFQIAPETVTALKKLGFDFVRLAVDPGIYLASDGPRRAEIISLVLARTQTLLASNFNVMVDLHPNGNNPAYGPDKMTVPGFTQFNDYSEMVRAMATALKGLPSGRVALELMNEPTIRGDAGIRQWQQMLQTLHASARAGAPTLPLVLNGCNYDGLLELTKLDLAPFRGSNVIYTLHYYEPHIFTHQGEVGDPVGHLNDLDWPPRANEQDHIRRMATAGVDTDPKLAPDARTKAKASLNFQINAYFAPDGGPQKTARDFATLADWARAQNIDPSRIVVGEFGASRPNPDSPAAMAARSAWVTLIRKTIESHGFGWAFWDLRGGGNWHLLAEGTTTSFDTNMTRALGLNG